MIGRFLEWFVCSFLARLFPARFRLIPRMQDGTPLLRQFKIFATREPAPGQPSRWHFGVYLQSFAHPEAVETFHVHRWRRMVSFVLSGLFVEERYPGNWYKSHPAPSVYTMNDQAIHRLAYVAPRTWTLFFMFGRARHEVEGGWGYFDRPTAGEYADEPLFWAKASPRLIRYTPWSDAIKAERRVKSL